MGFQTTGEGIDMHINITEPEAKILLDMLGKLPVQGLETMQVVLLLSVKLEAVITESNEEPD